MTMNFQPDSIQTMIVEAVDAVAPQSGIVGIAPVSCGAFLSSKLPVKRSLSNGM